MIIPGTENKNQELYLCDSEVLIPRPLRMYRVGLITTIITTLIGTGLSSQSRKGTLGWVPSYNGFPILDYSNLLVSGILS